jgi:hypothetical protein
VTTLALVRTLALVTTLLTSLVTPRPDVRW